MSADPRFVAAQRLRAKGRHEAAVQLLADLLLAATEGKSEQEQMSFELAPMYYEYGSSLASLARASLSDEDEDEERSAKRLKSSEPKEDELKEDDSEEEEGDEEEDGLLAWKLLDQARCIYESKVEDEECEASLRKDARSELARCCVQLGDLNCDGGQWCDAIVEYTICFEQ